MVLVRRRELVHQHWPLRDEPLETLVVEGRLASPRQAGGSASPGRRRRAVAVAVRVRRGGVLARGRLAALDGGLGRRGCGPLDLLRWWRGSASLGALCGVGGGDGGSDRVVRLVRRGPLAAGVPVRVALAGPADELEVVRIVVNWRQTLFLVAPLLARQVLPLVADLGRMQV